WSLPVPSVAMTAMNRNIPDNDSVGPSPQGSTKQPTGEHKTRHHNRNDRLRVDEERFRAFAEASSDMVYRMSPDWSAAWLLVGQASNTHPHAPGQTWIDACVFPDDQPLVREKVREAIHTKSPYVLEHRVIHTDGSFSWALSRAVPLLDEAGKIIEWLGTARDITAPKEVE